MKEFYEQREIEYSRGKLAGHDVLDDEGNVIVTEGEIITDDIIEEAKKKGKLHELMLSAVAAEVALGPPEIQPGMNLEEQMEAFVRGKIVGRDVFDWQGNLIAKAGSEVTDELVNMAANKGLLQELVLAVGAPGIHSKEEE